MVTERNIPRRSTLILLKDDAELGRIVAGTAKSRIKKLMDMGLAWSLLEISRRTGPSVTGVARRPAALIGEVIS